MKQAKRILVLFLVIGMLITVLPGQAIAESAGTQMADYQTFLKNLSVLEDYAADYAKENPGKDPAALTIKYIRAGADEFNTGFWNLIAGTEDSKFASYVHSREEAHNAANPSQKVNVTGLRNLGITAVTNGDKVDLGHLFAVLDAYYHNGGSNASADVAGWAGDLVDLMVLADSKGASGTLDEMVQTISQEYFLKDGAFSQSEYFGDLDGYAIAQKLMSADYASGTLSSIISNYYTQSLTDAQRAGYFLTGRLDSVTNRGDIRNAIFDGYTGNENVASLESSQSFAAESLSDLRKACCYAFADHLCMLAGDYVEWNENLYYSVVDSEKVTLTSGITHEKLTAATADDKQIVYYLATADVSNPYVNVYINYHNNDPAAGWGMQSVRNQAYAAEARHSDPSNEALYIPNYNVVVAVNGAGYNMSTGEPAGLLMMEGVEYHAPDGIDHNGYAFFGILKDGSAIIGSTEEYYDLKKQGLIMEGIDAFGTTLVKDGELAVSYSDSHIRSRASRTAVGITKTGKVVVMTLDGRQEPISCGGSMQEIAQIMLDAGCVDAINLDGGGSTTFLAQMPGDDDLSLVNSPSDGFERSVSASLIIVSTMPDPKAFDHAQLSAAVDYLTVGSQVQIQATGVNAVGDTVAVPEGVVWKVSDSTVASISADGVLTGLKNGKVDVTLTLGGRTVGTKTMQVVVPDTVYFEKATMGVVRGDTVALPVAARYAGKPVAIRASDLTITLSNQAGTVAGLNFTASASSTVKNVVVTAKLVHNAAVSGSMTVTLYNKGEAAFDFGHATAGTEQLAWLRQVTNATTGDGLLYSVTDPSKPMTSQYTVAFDAADLPISAAVQKAVFQQLGISQNANSVFMLQLADKISGTVTVKITLDKNLTVDTNNVALTSELFSLEKAELDSASNTLKLTMSWKAQSAPVNQENTNTVCILTGIHATPKQGASWDSRKRLNLVNEIAMDYSIVVASDALLAYAQANPGQGIAANTDKVNGGLITGSHTAGKDSYTLMNGLKNGWVYEEGGYAYYVDGVRYTGVRRVGEFYYDFGQSGINIGQAKYTGMFMENNVRRYAKNGVLTPGWYIEGDAHYFFDANGTGYNGTVKVDGVDMTFDNGLHTGGYTGFMTVDGKKYHYTSGRMDYGWVYVGSDLYHFNTDTGVMTTGTHIRPDEEAYAKGAYYDFAPDGRTLRGYFNGYGYYYWAGVPRRDAWVKSGADKDPEAWYRTNTNGHYVTDGTGKETFNLTIDGVTYKAVKIECEGVVYTFDTTNGKLLKGDFVLENGKWYYYWAGKPVNAGWFEVDGKSYYAYADGHLALGSNTIGGKTYMFGSQGQLITEGMILTAELSRDKGFMNIKLTEAPDPDSIRVAVWMQGTAQADTLAWFDMKETANGTWEVSVPMCRYDVKNGSIFEMHVYTGGDAPQFLIATTVQISKITKVHTYTDGVDGTCDICQIRRETTEDRTVMHMFRMYDPNSGEHFYTGSTVERDNLVAAGWHYEGVGFTFSMTTGSPVYRLYDPVYGEHLYTMDVEERDALIAEGWSLEGIAFNSAYDTEVPQYRLHNPNAKRGAYHFTASEEERDFLISLGWEYQGIGFYSSWK